MQATDLHAAIARDMERLRRYHAELSLYMMLQAAGPILTPQNMAKGLQSMPSGGGAHGPIGTWSFKGDHTATGFDGNTGAYIETYGGKRFQSGQWPAEEPPVYPKK